MEKYELKRNCMELVPCCSSQSGGRQTLLAKISALGDDNLLLEILTRLPTKSLIRFKSVSKHWNSLISQPYFDRRRHQLIISRNSTLPPFAFIFDYRDHNRGFHLSIIYPPPPISKSESEVFKSGEFSLRFLPCYRRPEIRLPIVVASYNDLLLCHTSRMSPTRRVVYTICNPLTMKLVDLPPAPRPKFDLEAFRVGIVCDPVSQQVAIVRVPNFNNGFSPMRRFKLHIFTTSHTTTTTTTTNRWIKLRLRCLPGFSSCCLTQPNSVVCDQILYWLCNDYILAYDAFGNNHSPHKDNDNDNDDNDDHRKNFCFINLPSDYKPHESNNRLGVCQGKLRLSQWLDSRNESVSEPALSIWELKEDYHNHTGSGTTKWSLEHKFFLKQFASETPKLVQLLKQGTAHMGIVIGFHPHDADIVYLHLKVCVVTCNIPSKTLELVYNISPRPSSFVFAMCVYPLVLPWWPTPVPALPSNVAAIPS